MGSRSSVISTKPRCAAKKRAFSGVWTSRRRSVQAGSIVGSNLRAVSTSLAITASWKRFFRREIARASAAEGAGADTVGREALLAFMKGFPKKEKQMRADARAGLVEKAQKPRPWPPRSSLYYRRGGRIAQLPTGWTPRLCFPSGKATFGSVTKSEGACARRRAGRRPNSPRHPRLWLLQGRTNEPRTPA